MIEVERPHFYPAPAKPEVNLSPVLKNTSGEPLNALWMDNYEDSVVILATDANDHLYRSIDNGVTFTKIYSALQVFNAFTTNNPDKDKSVLRVVNGRQVYMSTKLDGANSTWKEVLYPTVGTFYHPWGFCVYNNIVLLSTYGTKTADNPPNKVYLSRDYGETWTMIFERKVVDMPNPGNYHIHTVTFDPYNSRIWIQEADTDNDRVSYTDDYGKTWNNALGGFYHQQSTSIYAIPEGVVFGSDESPNGIKFLGRNYMETGAVPNTKDYKHVYSPSVLTEQLLYVAQNVRMPQWHMTDVTPYNLLIPWRLDFDGKRSRITASADGVQWWDIFDAWAIWGEDGVFIEKVCGPVTNDPNQLVHATINIPGENTRLPISFRFPVWKSLNLKG